MSEDERVDIYRLRLSKGTSSSSVSDWTLYDDYDKFVMALTKAVLEAETRHCGETRLKGLPHLLTRIWHLHTRDGKGESFGINRVWADRLVDGEWVELEFELVPPEVRLFETAKVGPR